jgi:hypothetical protein
MDYICCILYITTTAPKFIPSKARSPGTLHKPFMNVKHNLEMMVNLKSVSQLFDQGMAVGQVLCAVGLQHKQFNEL